MSATTITFNHVTKQFFLQEDRTIKEVLPALFSGKGWARQKTALRDLTFMFRQGETVGIVGRNGAGKSTVMKLIAGITYPSQGNILVEGRVAPLIELGAGFHHELSGYENIFLNAAILGMHKQEIHEKLNEIISFSGLEDYIHVSLKRYSTGMQMRLAFAVAIHTNASILLIDEVLAVGDAEFQERCLRKLEEIKSQTNNTIVFISHDQKAVEKFCERVIVLDAGELVFDGKPEPAFKHYNQLLRHT